MKEYKFDVKLWAIVTVTAESEAAARVKLDQAPDVVDINYSANGVVFTDACFEEEGNDDLLYVDGEPV